MKPISLTMKGLRSYREQVEIVFPEHGGLMAIIGDTGAGKSSILEGVVYALYSGATWTGFVRDLIADDEDEMRVAFVFEVDGVRWKIVRAHRRSVRTSSHKLENLSTGEVVADQERSVTQRASEIVGFDRETFLSAVLLPQGRFMRLLLATEGERSEILGHLLGLDELEDVRELADSTISRLHPLSLAVERLLGKLGDPQTDLAAALDAVSIATDRQAALDLVASAYAVAIEDAKRSDHQTQALQGAAKVIQQAQLASPAAALAKVKKLASEIAEGRGKQTAALASAIAGVAAATQSLATANEGGAGIAPLLAAIETLNFLSGELRRLDLIATELDTRRPTFEARRATILIDSERIERLEKEAATLGVLRATAAADVTPAQDRLDHARTEMNALTALREETAKAVVLLATAREEQAGHEQASADARSEVEKQAVIFNHSQQAFADAERADHAASCAHGSRPGDPCPVCGTILGKDFVPPRSNADLDTLRQAFAAAETDRRKADAVLARREGEQTKAEEEVKRLTTDVERREKATTAQTNVAADLLPGVDLALPIVEALRGLSAAVQERLDIDKAAEIQLTEARLALAGAKAEHSAASATLDSDERQFRTDETEWRRCTREADRRRGRLPAAFRPDLGSTVETIQTAAKVAKERLEELRGVERARDDEERQREAAQSALDALSRREQTEVHTPAGNAWTKLVTLRATVAAAAELLGSNHPIDLDDAADIAGRALQAEHLDGESQQTLSALEMAGVASTRATAESKAEAMRIIADAGFENASGLTSAVKEAVKLIGAAEAQAADARARIEPVRALAEVCEPFKQRIDALQVVKETVTQSTFVAEMRRRRETHLLRAASQELMGLSEDRYEFVVPDIGRKSDRFVIWDHYTQRERSPQTLSGGETFLASLALALGLSEILSRRSQRIESLWLDEGFASLDDGALDDAIAALERAAANGRLIAVVTHLKKVMQSIDQVLAIQRTLKGSQAHWAGTTERARTAVEEATAGLLT